MPPRQPRPTRPGHGGSRPAGPAAAQAINRDEARRFLASGLPACVLEFTALTRPSPEHALELARWAAPSVGEPFGLVYLEAMASGTPVVASASGGPLGFVRPVGPQPTGWLPAPGDAEDLQTTLLSALTHPEEITRRGRNARAFAAQHYSWRTITDRYTQVYDRVQAGTHA